MASTFRTTLARDLGEPVDIYDASLNQARFAEPESERPFVDFLQERFAGRPLDLVVPIGGPASRFVAQHRERLFGGAPVLYTAVDPRLVPAGALQTNATLVTREVNLPGLIEDVLQLQPDTTNIVVASGTSPLEQFWINECQRAWQPFTNRVGFRWLNTLSLRRMQQHVRSLPPHSFIVYWMLLVDADGVPYDKSEALTDLHAAANAPIFGYFRTHLGQGAIGGRLYEEDLVARQAAEVASRLLRGAKPSNFPPKVLTTSTPIYDWRELRRWRIPPQRLPAGSIIAFRERTLWEKYHWHAAGVLAVCGLQSALIIGLVFQRSKRRQEEAAAALIADLSSRFIHLSPEAVDGEIRAAQRRICECLRLDMCALWQWANDGSRKAILTHLYRPPGQPPLPEAINGLEYFPWCARQLLAGQSVCVTSPTRLPPEAARDRETFEQWGIKFNLSVPLVAADGQVLGAISFNTLREGRVWSPAIGTRLQTVAQIFANALLHRQADRALRESEERLRLAAESGGTGLWSTDLTTQKMWVSPKLRQLFGFEPEGEVTAEHFRRATSPEIFEQVRRGIQHTAETGVTLALEHPVVLPDGHRRWLALHAGRQCDATGKPMRIVGTCVDITERKLAEEALRESETRLTVAAESAEAGLWVLDCSKRIFWATERALALFGLGPKENLSLERFYAVIHPEDREAAEQAVERALTIGEPLHHEYRLARPDGGVRWVSSRGRSYFTPTGQPERLMGVTMDITEPKLVQLALEQSEENLRRLVQESGIAIGIARDNVITFANKKYLELFGYASEAEVCGRPVLSQWAPECQEMLAERLRRRQEGLPVPGEVEGLGLRKDGSTFYVHATATYLQMPAGPVSIVFLTDITERKRALEALRESEEHLSLATESAGAGLWSMHLDTGRSWVTPRMRELLQFRPEGELTFEDFLQAVHPEDRPLIVQATRQAVETGAEIRIEHRVLLRDGSVRWLSARGRRHCDGAGKPTRLAGTSIDITESKRVQEELREREEESRATFEQAAVGIGHVGPRGRWLRVNDRLCSILGYPREELLELTFQAITHPEDLKVDLKLVRQLLCGQLNTCTREKRYFREDGSVVWVNVSASLVRSATGEPRYFITVVEDITERKRAEEALLKHEARLLAAVDAAGLGFYEQEGAVDGERRTFMDKRLGDLLGIPPDQAEGVHQSWMAHLHPADLQRVAGISHAFEAGGQDHAVVEYRYSHAERGVIWLRHAAQVLARDATGRAVRVIGVLHDITEPKRDEEALRETQTTLSAIIDSTDDLVWSVDPRSFGLLTFNQGLREYFLKGRGIQIEPGMRPEDLFPPGASVQAWQGFYRRALQEGPFTTEYATYTRHLVLQLSFNVLKRDGRVFGISAFGKDITERKRAEAQLKESEERLRLVLEANSEGIWDWHIPSGRAFFSARYSGMLGYTPEEFPRDYAGWKALVHPDDFERLNSEQLEHLRRGTAFCVDFRMRKKSGDWCWIRTRGTVVERDAEGQAIRMVGTHQDTTEQRRAELEARELRNNLAHSGRVTVLGQLASALAHELNQPLGAILRNAEAAELLLQEPVPDLQELQAIIRDVIADDQRAGKVIDRLRSLLKRRSLDLQPIELGVVVAEILPLVQGDAVARRVKLEYVPASKSLEVRGDRIHLQQVLLNLLVNAMDALTTVVRPQRCVRISARQTDAGLAEIRVCDNGPGILDGVPERLFQPFFSTKANGMGMGLAVSKTIIEAHQGAIWAENRPEGGACFCFTLPLTERRLASTATKADS